MKTLTNATAASTLISTRISFSLASLLLLSFSSAAQAETIAAAYGLPAIVRSARCTLSKPAPSGVAIGALDVFGDISSDSTANRGYLMITSYKEQTPTVFGIPAAFTVSADGSVFTAVSGGSPEMTLTVTTSSLQGKLVMNGESGKVTLDYACASQN